MSKLFLTFTTLLLLSVAAYGQSGRAKGSTGGSAGSATGKWPTPPVPAASPQPDSTKASTATPPKIVDGERIYSSKEVDERLQILKKPTPGYTREARRHNTRGYVVLRAILAADGTIKNIEVMTGLPDGLTEKAIEAARQIKFKPAIKNGKSVSAWVELQYRFQIY